MTPQPTLMICMCPPPQKKKKLIGDICTVPCHAQITFTLPSFKRVLSINIQHTQSNLCNEDLKNMALFEANSKGTLVWAYSRNIELK